MMQKQGGLTTASSSQGFGEFEALRIRSILSRRLSSKNAMKHLKMTLRHAQFDFPFSLTYSNRT